MTTEKQNQSIEQAELAYDEANRAYELGCKLSKRSREQIERTYDQAKWAERAERAYVMAYTQALELAERNYEQAVAKEAEKK